MINELLESYIKDFILKSGEELEWVHHNNDNFLLEVRIIKRSERTYRVVGFLIVSTQSFTIVETINDHKLDALKFTPRKKVSLDDDRKTFKWLEEGWVIKEVRFEKDEKTVRNSHYRMGFRLYQYQFLKMQQKNEKTRHEFFQIKNQILTTQTTENYDLLHLKEQGIQNILQIFIQLDEDSLSTSVFFPQKWQLEKRLKYLHFVNAVCQLCLLKKEFDWKEIGANYFQKIGGSKVFDVFKQEFLDHLEEWTGVPTVELGLTSLGQITPVFFAGHLSGRFSNFDWGPVHALTNLSIANEEYQTKATTLWLVENRAILTRMAATEDFLRETNALIICVDGHLRSAHKNTISKILGNSEMEQVLIWCDYDPDGLQISKEIYTIVNQYNNLKIKFIMPVQQVVNHWNLYKQYLTKFLEDTKMEQEQMMGGVAQWRKWIRD